MTLIATLRGEESIGFIGDLLISNDDTDPQKKKFAIDTPTVRNINSILKKGEICHLAQKLALISGRLAMGWAGSYKDAKTVIADIYNSEAKSQISYSDIMKKLKNYGKGQDRFYLIGIIIKSIDGEKIDVNIFGWDSHIGLIPPNEVGLYLKTLYSFGSGATDLNNLLLNEFIEPPSRGKTTSAGSGFILNIVGLMGDLIGKQMRHGHGIESLYGGGYEGIVFRGKEIKKLDKILFVNLEIIKVDDKFEIKFFPFVKALYQGDVLKIVRYEVQKLSSDLGESEGIIQHFYMEPIYRALSQDEISQLIFDHLNYEFSALTINLPQANEIFTTVTYNLEQKLHYVLLEDEGFTFRIKFTKRFNSEIMPKIETFLLNV